MRGSILINFNELIDDRGPDNFLVAVNGVTRDFHSTDINNYYSTFCFPNDLIDVTVVAIESAPVVSIIRKDFTTDDEGGDRGIKETSQAFTIITGITNTTFRFTATTTPDAYDFHYVVDISTLQPTPTPTMTPTPTPTPTPTYTPLLCFNVGTGFDDTALSISRQSNGTLVASGAFYNFNSTLSPTIINLNEDATVNLTYQNNLVASISALQSDDKILYAGGTSNSSSIKRFNTNGTVDVTFISPVPFTNPINCIKVLSDDSIMLGLQPASIIKRYNNLTTIGLVKLNPNGSVNRLFPNELDGAVLTIEEQTDNKLILGGGFENVYGTSSNHIVRLNTDFTIDTGFTVGTGFNTGLEVIKLQSDGKILCGGDFSSYNGTTRHGICRLNSDGTLDTSFVPFEGGLISASVYDILIQTDGKIIVVGEFNTTLSGTTLNGIIRYNSDGTRDNTFNTGTGFSTSFGITRVYKGLILPNGKIILVGRFTSYNGLTSNNIIRLNSDGTEDNCP